MPAFRESVSTDWDDILLKECERIMATPTSLPNETLRILKLGDDTEVVADGESTSSISEESPVVTIHRPVVRPKKSRKLRRSGRTASSSQLPSPTKLSQNTRRRVPPELRQSKSTRSLLLNRQPRQETKQKSLVSSFFDSTPLDITDPTGSETSRTLSNFFGTKVDDSRPSPTPRKQSPRTTRSNRQRQPQTKAAETAGRTQDPIRTQQLSDPAVRFKSLEELMMERFPSLKLEEAICLVADARTNLGINKWQHWGIQLYDECERLYAESYDTPSAKKSSRKLKAETASSNVGQLGAVPSLEMPNVSALFNSPSRRTIVSTTEEASSIEDASGWESTSGWSSLWEDSNALQGGYSLKTYDQNDEYTIDVIKEIERTFLELEAKDQQIHHRRHRTTLKQEADKHQEDAYEAPRNNEIQGHASKQDNVESKTQRRKWFDRFRRKK